MRFDMCRLRWVCLFMITSVCTFAVSACASQRGGPAASVVVRNDAILLVPNIEAGEVGWCVSEPSGYSCPDGPVRTPIIAESWSGESQPPVSEGYALTTGQVATVSIGGRRVRTRYESALPRGLRVVTVEVHGRFGSKLTPIGHLRFLPFDASGKAITERVSSREPFKLPTQPVSDPEHPSDRMCEIRVSAPLRGLAAEKADTVVAVKPYNAPIGNTLASCANTQYRLGGRRLKAAVMLNASYPGTAPGFLPGMRSLSGGAGVFEAPGVEGEMVGRRIRGAWLFVSGSGALEQRLAVLNHLSASVNL